MDSTARGGSMKQEDEWGEDTSRSRKMGGVYLGEGKNGGSRVKGRKKQERSAVSKLEVIFFCTFVPFVLFMFFTFLHILHFFAYLHFLRFCIFLFCTFVLCHLVRQSI